MLDEDADEPLQRSVDRAVDGDRPLGLAVLVDVVEVEALGQVEVALDRAQLPRATDGVAYVATADAVLGFDVATGERVASYPRGGALLRPGVGSVDGRALLVFLDAGAASGASPCWRCWAPSS